MPNPLAERPTSPPFATGSLLIGGLVIAACVLGYLWFAESSREPLARPARVAAAAVNPGPAAPPAPAPIDAEDRTKVDPAPPAAAKVARLTGTLRSDGSDTLNNLMLLWAEEFRALHPEFRLEIEGKGSSLALPALTAGTAQLGPMSRAMKSSEIDDFRKKFGYAPTQIRVALDALAIYVHKDNPVEQLTLAQVDSLFGKERQQGFAKDALTWGDVGVTGEWAELPVVLFGRNSASGTYGFFKERVLKNGDFKDTVKEQPGSASVILGVTEDRGGVGFAGTGYKTSGVRAVPLARDPSTQAIRANEAAVQAGSYPLSRFLYLCFNQAPDRPLDPLLKEFLSYVLSIRGQKCVEKDGFFQLPAEMAAKELERLQ